MNSSDESKKEGAFDSSLYQGARASRHMAVEVETSTAPVWDSSPAYHCFRRA